MRDAQPPAKAVAAAWVLLAGGGHTAPRAAPGVEHGAHVQAQLVWRAVAAGGEVWKARRPAAAGHAAAVRHAVCVFRRVFAFAQVVEQRARGRQQQRAVQAGVAARLGRLWAQRPT